MKIDRELITILCIVVALWLIVLWWVIDELAK